MPAQDFVATNASSSQPTVSVADDPILARQMKIAAKTAEKTLPTPTLPAAPTQDDVGDVNEDKTITLNEFQKITKLATENQEELPNGVFGEKINSNAIDEITKTDIFKLLGMNDLEEAEKKKNLDEMEETIWQDFTETDLPEMLEGEQKEKYLDLLKTSPSAEKIIMFFGNKLPANFEEKYLAKTLRFKAEITREQVETLLLALGDSDKEKIDLLKRVKIAIDNGRWKEAESLMATYPS